MSSVFGDTVRLLLSSFLILSSAFANPIIVYDDVREVQMTSEAVLLRVHEGDTTVTGRYNFTQLSPTTEKDEYVRILVPVYTEKDANLDLATMKRAYSPQVTVNGSRFDAESVAFGKDPWKSWWRGTYFDIAAFEFVIPRAKLRSNEFQVEIEYHQPHMVARGRRFTCYLPFRPAVSNPHYKPIPDERFQARIIPDGQLRLHRVSTNAKVLEETLHGITVICRHREHIVVRIDAR